MFARDVWPAVQRKYVDTGKVLVAFRHLPIASHQFARNAAEAGVCAAKQGRFWSFYDWMFERKGAMERGTVQQGLVGAGIEQERFAQCMRHEASAGVEADLAIATDLGLYATPTFIIGRLEQDGDVEVKRMVVGYRPIDEFLREVEVLILAV